MDKFEEYKALLDENDITAVKERREAITKAIDTLIAQMDQFNAERKALDEKERQLFSLARGLDEAHARITRGLKYTPQVQKRIVRRFWNDDTHVWVEQFLLEWVRKQLQDGPKAIGTLQYEKPGRFAMSDVVELMEAYAEEFTHGKGAKPTRKYARVDYVWSLKDNVRRSTSPNVPRHWNVEASMASEIRERKRTLSEHMHEMLEEAIQSFHNGKSTTVIHAFNDLYWKEFANGFIYYKQQAEFLQFQIDAAKQTTVSKAALPPEA